MYIYAGGPHLSVEASMLWLGASLLPGVIERPRRVVQSLGLLEDRYRAPVRNANRLSSQAFRTCQPSATDRVDESQDGNPCSRTKTKKYETISRGSSRVIKRYIASDGEDLREILKEHNKADGRGFLIVPHGPQVFYTEDLQIIEL